MILLIFHLTITLAFSAPVLAQSMKVERIPETVNFASLSAEAMAPKSVYFQFTSNPPPFTDWIASPEAEFLNLWEDFREPESITRRRKQRVTEKMRMFTARAKTVINKAPANFKLQDYATTEFMRKLDPELKHETITAAQTMPVVAGQPNIQNFQKLCNTGTEKPISRPGRELSMAESQRPREPWCSNTSRSVCVESCYIFNTGYQVAVGTINLNAADVFEEKDYGMASQSELRYFVSESEWGKRKPVSTITGINSPVRGVIEQNIFYFNQLVIYGKVVAIFQEHPTDAGKTIVTSFLVFGMQATTWERCLIAKTGCVSDILMGNGGGRLNTTKGITAGLPNYTRDIAKTIAEILEK